MQVDQFYIHMKYTAIKRFYFSGPLLSRAGRAICYLPVNWLSGRFTVSHYTYIKLCSNERQDLSGNTM